MRCTERALMMGTLPVLINTSASRVPLQLV